MSGGSLRAFSGILLLGLAGIFIFAQESAAQEPFFKPASFGVTVYGGNFDPNPEPQFIGARNDYSYGVNLGVDLNAFPYLGLDLELLGTNQDYDTPLTPPFAGSLDNDTSVQTAGLLFGLRIFYPASSRFRVYGVAGLGFYYTDMTVSGSVFGFPGVYHDDDRSTELYYGAGIRYRHENWSVGIHYRNIELTGDFPGFQISDADLGGEVLALGVGYHF